MLGIVERRVVRECLPEDVEQRPAGSEGMRGTWPPGRKARAEVLQQEPVSPREPVVEAICVV